MIDIHGNTESVLIAPDGVEYIQAAANQRAHLIVQAAKCSPSCTSKECSGHKSRWHKYAGSSQERKAEKATVLVEAHKARTKAKRVTRKAKAAEVAAATA